MHHLGNRAARAALAVLAAVVAAVTIVVVALPTGAARADVGVQGIYALNSRLKADPNDTTAWSIEWQVPQLENPQEAQGAIGQWMFNLETGIYYLPDTGWWVYYFDDNNGLDGNNPDCAATWGDKGGACQSAGMGHLPVGTIVTFTYRRCTPYPAHAADTNGSQLCAYVDVHDGRGTRFLAEDTPTVVEMYAHDIETFGDGPAPEPIVSCATPTVMRRQFIETRHEAWHQLTGDQWTFEDTNDRYKFATVDRAAGSWSSCYDSGNLALHQAATGSTPCAPDEGPDKAVNGTIGGGNSDKWCSAATDKTLQVDLGRVTEINRFVVQHAGAGGEPAVWNTRDYAIWVSDDATNWTPVVAVIGNTANARTHEITATRARYIQLDIMTPTQDRSGAGAARIYELEAYDVDGDMAVNRAATGSTPTCAADQGPDKAVNGTHTAGTSDKWCSSATTKWLQVDLGSVRGVDGFVIYHAGAGGEPATLNTRAYTIKVSRDGTTWRTLVTATANTANTTPYNVPTAQARYVRLDITTPTQDTTGAGAARIYDLAVFGL